MTEMTRDRVRLMLDDVFMMWGGMHGNAAHHAECLQHVDEIAAAFRDSDTADEVLARLVQVEGIGPPIATGILWAFDPSKYVPFDKKTTGYCHYRKWMHTVNLRLGYERICRRIVDAGVGEGKDHESIRALVLAAEELPEDFWVSVEWSSR
jgi:hypothetical protein